ncbi:MAG: TonB family protein [Bacteroidales bacterium]|nr:TonB family protein [Bacteroidales bacterium]
MKTGLRKIAVFLTFLATGFTAGAQYRTGYQSLYDSETVQSFRDHISYISSPSMEGRMAGSEGELETARYISSVFKKYNVDMLSSDDGDLFGLKTDSGDTLRSRNVVGFIQGYDKKLREKYIVIGARMDNLGVSDMSVNGEKTRKVYYGANGNASGVAMLLELARMLKTNEILLRRSVLLIGFGGSEVLNSGAWYFLNRTFPEVENIDAMINLDMLGTGSAGFYAYTSSNQDMNDIVNSLSKELQPIYPELTSAEPYPSDHRAFYDRQIPSVFFTTGRYAEHDTDKDTEEIIDYPTMERELEYIYNYSVALNVAEKPAFSTSEELRKNRFDETVVPYYDCDYKPAFFRHTDPRYFLEKWVYQYLKYPQGAVREGIQGRVLVDFVINEKGKVTDVKVRKGVDELLDAEAVRVISASPDWTPGRFKGKTVKTGMSLYVEFRLEKKGTKHKLKIKK